MPTYAYACTACSHRFEAVQTFTDASLTECPECAGRLRKLFSSVGVVFKGSGFYRTDNRKVPSSEKPQKSEKKEAAGAGSSSETSTASGAKASPPSSTTGTTTQAKAAS